MKKYLAISAAFLAFSAQPLQITDLAHFDDVGLFAAAEAGNGRGGGNGNGNGNGNNGNGNSGKSGGASAGLSGGGISVASVSDVGSGSDKIVGQSKVKNLNASLGRLNSLGRNINGLMRSSDPHMAEIRTYILNSVELTKAEASLAGAQTALMNAQSAYDAALAAYDAAAAEYNAALADPELAATADASAMNAALATLQNAEVTLTSAQDAVTSAETAVAEYQALTTDEVLTDALLAGSNTGVVTTEVLDWSKSVLGVGEETGAIDAYMAKFQ
jgi:hypothetical protein